MPPLVAAAAGLVLGLLLAGVPLLVARRDNKRLRREVSRKLRWGCSRCECLGVESKPIKTGRVAQVR